MVSSATEKNRPGKRGSIREGRGLQVSSKMATETLKSRPKDDEGNYLST